MLDFRLFRALFTGILPKSGSSKKTWYRFRCVFTTCRSDLTSLFRVANFGPRICEPASRFTKLRWSKSEGHFPPIWYFLVPKFKIPEVCELKSVSKWVSARPGRIEVGSSCSILAVFTFFKVGDFPKLFFANLLKFYMFCPKIKFFEIAKNMDSDLEL